MAHIIIRLEFPSKSKAGNIWFWTAKTTANKRAITGSTAEGRVTQRAIIHRAILNISSSLYGFRVQIQRTVYEIHT